MKRKWYNSKKNRLIAAAAALAIVITSLAVGLSGTFALKPPVNGDFTVATNSYPKVGVGQTLPYVIPGAAYASSSNAAIASVPPPLNGQPMTGALNITGVGAGVAVVSVGSTMGLVMGMPIQVFNNNYIVKYQIPNGGEVFFSAPGKTVASPVKVETTTNTAPVNTAAFNDIDWESLQEDVATVDTDGNITAVAKGAAIITGTFTDKWGVRQILHVLVGVETSFGNSKMDDLLRALAKAKEVREDADDPDNAGKYDADELLDLDAAVLAGGAVLENPASTDANYEKAAKDIWDILDHLTINDGSLPLIPGPGEPPEYWLRPLGRPRNVYEVLDENKQSSYPPEYIYNEDGTPGNGKDRKVYGPRNGLFYVEDPEGSNIFKPVDSEGELLDEGAIWGGQDKGFGSEDDKHAVKNEESGKWYADLGQNVFQEINTTAPIGGAARGQLTGQPFGAGEDGEPGSEDDLLPLGDLVRIFLHKDGKYYAGPYTTVADGTFFIGDKLLWQDGDGALSSSGDASAGTYASVNDSDQRWYMDGNGNMVTGRTNYSVNGVIVEPDEIDLFQGSGYQFTATVTASTGATPPQDVHWEVIGNNSPATIINNYGMLSIATDETSKALTVKATSIIAPAYFDTATVSVTDAPPVLTKATVHKISTGMSSFLIKDNDVLWSTGYNNRGQLGVGNLLTSRAFAPVPNPATSLTFATVSEFTYSSNATAVGITTDGTLYTWGYNNRGQLGIGSTTGNRDVPGQTNLSATIKFKAAAAGYCFCAAIAQDGTLYTWGYNNYGQLGIGSTTNRSTPAQTNLGNTVKFKAVSAGYGMMYAIAEDGTLWAWGRNNYGQLGDGSTTNSNTPRQVPMFSTGSTVKVKAVAAKSMYHALAITEDGSLWSWGYNGYGQLGDGSTNRRGTPLVIAQASATTKYKEVATGYYHSMALTEDGRLFAWGRNNYGQVGDGSTTTRRSPVFINYGGLKYKAMAAGEVTSMAVSEEGRLYFWGRNNYGQYGNGLTANRYQPHLVPLA